MFLPLRSHRLLRGARRLRRTFRKKSRFFPPARPLSPRQACAFALSPPPFGEPSLRSVSPFISSVPSGRRFLLRETSLRSVSLRGRRAFASLVSTGAQSLRPVRDLSFRRASETSANFSKNPVSSRPPTRFASQPPGVRLVSFAGLGAFASLHLLAGRRAGAPLVSAFIGEPPRSTLKKRLSQ